VILISFFNTHLKHSTIQPTIQQFFKEPKEEPFGMHTIIKDPNAHLISVAQIESKSAEGFDLLGFVGTD
jgi:hypothetical protein